MNIAEVIENFLSYVFESNPILDSELTELIAHLDRLALAVANSNYVFDETDYPDAPDSNYKETYEKVSKRFPMLGYYNCVIDVSINISSTDFSLGDAIDDIADIVGDLERVLWCFKNTSENDALWNLHNNFNIHWGRHLRDLQLYLHDHSY